MNKLTVYNEEGELEEVEVLDFYHLDEYDHEYVLYTKGEEASTNDIFTYYSIITQVSENEFKFEKITDPEEDKKVEELINQEIDKLMDGR